MFCSATRCNKATLLLKFTSQEYTIVANISYHSTNSLFYGAALDWQHDTDNNTFGGQLIIGYNF